MTKDATSLVAAAMQSPSSHNTQPWRFALREGAIDLMADRTRRLPVNDPDDRELAISCGCALMTLRVQAAAEGLGNAVALAPDASRPDLLATVSLTGSPDPDLAGLAPAIAARRTVRTPFKRGAVPDDLARALVHAAEAEGARLDDVASAAARQKLAALVTEGDAAQWRDAEWRRELAAWMRPPSAGDGLTAPAFVVPFLRLVVSRFDAGQRTGQQDAMLLQTAPRVMALGTAGDTLTDWLKAGQALQRVLLTAASQAVQAGYLNQPIQVGALRERCAALVPDAGMPQALLRLGRVAKTPAAKPRRALEQVLV